MRTDAPSSAWRKMSLGRYEREVLILLFVVVLATTGCGGRDAAQASPRDREGGASAPAAKPAETPARGEESPSEEGAAGEERSPVAGPKRAGIMRRLYGRRIRVDRKRVTIARQTLACGHAGTVRLGEQRRIRHGCVQPTFPAGSVVGPDAIFRVHSTPSGRLVITDARFASY